MYADDWFRFWVILGTGIATIVGVAFVFVKVGTKWRDRP